MPLEFVPSARTLALPGCAENSPGTPGCRNRSANTARSASMPASPRIAADVYSLLEQSRTLGITMLLVDQNIAEAVRIADDVYLFGMGRVQREGPRASFAADLAAIVRSALVG